MTLVKSRLRRRPIQTLRRLAEPLATLRVERLARVERVPARVVAREDTGDG
jgi:hypothetical protein